MTDGPLMDAECVHGVPWYECEECDMTDERPGMEFRHPKRLAAIIVVLAICEALVIWRAVR